MTPVVALAGWLAGCSHVILEISGGTTVGSNFALTLLPRCSNRLKAMARALPSNQRTMSRVLAQEPLSTRYSSRMVLAALTSVHELVLEEQDSKEERKASASALV